MAAHRGTFAVDLMCRVLGVSRSGFYAWLQRDTSERARADQRLVLEVRSIHQASKKRYGSPRIHAELQERGIRCSEKRVARLMRVHGLRAKKRRQFRVTTCSDHREAVAPNLLERAFAVSSEAQPDRVWVSDITYLPTREGWLYLAVVVDLASRLVVGWALSESLDRSVAVRALQMALLGRAPRPGLLHHSDRGVQYAAREYRALLVAHGIRASMSRQGDCWDNAVAESFFATLEWELAADADWHTRREARQAVFEYIEIWYNRQRRHSTLGYMTPARYDEMLALKGRAA